jgi:mono/diheme cytochrome c family protein
LASGETIYKAACLACHGEKGTGGHGGGPTLIGKLDATQIRIVTTTGRNNMPTFRQIYDANQIQDVSEYIVQKLAHPQ